MSSVVYWELELTSNILSTNNAVFTKMKFCMVKFWFLPTSLFFNIKKFLIGWSESKYLVCQTELQHFVFWISLTLICIHLSHRMYVLPFSLMGWTTSPIKHCSLPSVWTVLRWHRSSMIMVHHARRCPAETPACRGECRHEVPKLREALWQLRSLQINVEQSKNVLMLECWGVTNLSFF